MEKINQKQIVLKHLKTYGSITSLTAIYSYDITRLSDVIFCLKKSYNIATEMVYKGRKKYAKYVLMGGITQ